MADSFITIDIQDRIAIVRFDRGDKANALSVEALRQLSETARSFHARPDISAVILTGNARNFSLGADLKDPARAAQKDDDLANRRIALRAGPEMCEAWEKVDASPSWPSKAGASAAAQPSLSPATCASWRSPPTCTSPKSRAA